MKEGYSFLTYVHGCVCVCVCLWAHRSASNGSNIAVNFKVLWYGREARAHMKATKKQNKNQKKKNQKIWFLLKKKKKFTKILFYSNPFLAMNCFENTLNWISDSFYCCCEKYLRKRRHIFNQIKIEV